MWHRVRMASSFHFFFQRRKRGGRGALFNLATSFVPRLITHTSKIDVCAHGFKFDAQCSSIVRYLYWTEHRVRMASSFFLFKLYPFFFFIEGRGGGGRSSFVSRFIMRRLTYSHGRRKMRVVNRNLMRAARVFKCGAHSSSIV